MLDIVDRFELEFYRKKNPELILEMLNQLLDVGSRWVMVTTFSDGRLVFVNDSLLKLLQVSRDEIIGKAITDLNLCVYPNQYPDLKKKILQDGHVENMEFVMRIHQGQMHGTYLMNARPVNLLGVYCIIFVGWDITERKQREEELESSLKSDLRQTVQAIDNMVFKLVREADGRMTFVMSEGKVARMLNITTEEIYGKTPDDLFTAWQIQGIKPYMEKALLGESVRFEYAWDEEHELMFSLAPFYEHGQITGIVGTVIDITERKKLEKLLQVSELNSALGQLAAGVAHEIRNPLTAIKGFVQLIGETLEKHGIDKEAQYVDLILMELSRINHLVTEMLWLRKPKETKYEEVAVWTLWQEILPLVLVDANLKSIQVSLQVNSKSPRILADLGLLKQVILNVCKNAIEAMDEGGNLDIRDSYTSDHLTIMIKDSGPGIPQEILGKLFTPFFTTKPKGTGLGLFICKQIIHEMNGTIDISSDSTGTTVIIQFPLYKPQE
jgi:PAS domain S-box-containing protein